MHGGLRRRLHLGRAAGPLVEALVDLSTRVGAVEFVSPVIAASGTYGYGLEYDGLVDWSRVGGVSVKGLSLGPWTGHGPPRMTETPAGVLNAIGLHNIGVEARPVKPLSMG